MIISFGIEELGLVAKRPKASSNLDALESWIKQNALLVDFALEKELHPYSLFMRGIKDVSFSMRGMPSAYC